MFSMRSRQLKSLGLQLIVACVVLYGIIYITVSVKPKSAVDKIPSVFEAPIKQYVKNISRIPSPYFLSSDQQNSIVIQQSEKGFNRINFDNAIAKEDLNDGTSWYEIIEERGSPIIEADRLEVKVSSPRQVQNQLESKKSGDIDKILDENKAKTPIKKQNAAMKDARYLLIKNSLRTKYGEAGLDKFDSLLLQGHTLLSALRTVESGEEFAESVIETQNENLMQDGKRKEPPNSKNDVALRIFPNGDKNNAVKTDTHRVKPASVKLVTVLSQKEYYEMQMDMIEKGVTQSPEMSNIRIEVKKFEDDKNGNVINATLQLTEEEFRKWKADEFVRMVANPMPKSKVAPTLMPYNNSLARPNPLALIKDRSVDLNSQAVQKELSLQLNRRISFGDTDLKQIPEVKMAIQKAGPNKIPNIVHFIWFKCHTVKVHHYLSWLSAFKHQDPDVILFHTNCTPSGQYWEHIKKSLGSKLFIVKRTPPISVWGRKIEGVEHQSDVARLHILIEVGGIYLDDDVIVLKNLDRFRNESIVMGEENYDALANSIIMANPSSWFLMKWYLEYRNFNDSKWSYSSCFVPWSLWQIFPETIRVVKETMLRPNWEEIKYIYHELWDWSNNYSIHLYSRFMGALDGTPERSLKELAVLNTTYGEIARYVLWGNKQARNITNWLI